MSQLLSRRFAMGGDRAEIKDSFVTYYQKFVESIMQFLYEEEEFRGKGFPGESTGIPHNHVLQSFRASAKELELERILTAKCAEENYFEAQVLLEGLRCFAEVFVKRKRHKEKWRPKVSPSVSPSAVIEGTHARNTLSHANNESRTGIDQTSGKHS